jgi:hypothetical protein
MFMPFRRELLSLMSSSAFSLFTLNKFTSTKKPNKNERETQLLKSDVKYTSKRSQVLPHDLTKLQRKARGEEKDNTSIQWPQSFVLPTKYNMKEISYYNKINK